MAFWGDYHTHTTYSHGKGNVIDNALVAARKGLKQIAITDHGLRHMVLGIHRKELPKMIDDCKNATAQTGVLVLAGIENNLCSFDGDLDARDSDLQKIDIIQAGYHKAAVAPNIVQHFAFQLRNLINGMRSYVSKRLLARNTDAYLKFIERYKPDFVGHLNRDIHADALTVARYAKECGTYIELNGKRLSLTDAEIEKMAEEGVNFICNSDAHSPEKVGDMGLALQAIERLHIPYELIGNWDKLPNFRSQNYNNAVARYNETFSAQNKMDDKNDEDSVGIVENQQGENNVQD